MNANHSISNARNNKTVKGLKNFFGHIPFRQFQLVGLIKDSSIDGTGPRFPFQSCVAELIKSVPQYIPFLHILQHAFYAALRNPRISITTACAQCRVIAFDLNVVNMPSKI